MSVLRQRAHLQLVSRVVEAGDVLQSGRHVAVAVHDGKQLLVGGAGRQAERVLRLEGAHRRLDEVGRHDEHDPLASGTQKTGSLCSSHSRNTTK